MNVLEPGMPCTYCQVRPDVACRHRPAETDWGGIRDRRPPPPPLDKAASYLNGIRQIRNARTGRMVRIRGRGD